MFVRLLRLLFAQNPVPVAPQQNIRQTQFQRSVQNQVGQPGFNQPPQFNPFQQTVNNPFAQQEQFQSFNRPVASPLIQQQQLPVRPQANFHPSNQIAFPQQPQNSFVPNNFAPEPSRQVQSPQFNAPLANFQPQPQNNFQQPQRNPFLQSTQALPLEQRANLFLDSRTEEQRQKEQQLRQKLIEKQEKFSQKYYQKQQQQVQELHKEFLQKQQAIQKQAEEKLRPHQAALVQQQNFNRHQGVQPTDFSAFEKSVNEYYKQNPTTTTTTTTQAPVTTSSPLLTVVPLKKAKSKSEIKTLNAEDIQQLLGSRQGLFGASKTETAKKTKTAKSASPLNKEDLLRQLQQQILHEGGPEGTQDIVLPNGEKVQVIRTSDPELIRKAKSGNANVFEQTLSTTTPPPLSLEDLAKGGILPPGADFEVIKQSEDGLQKVKKVPQQKKVTFVYLEEQDDGSYKVQGVKGNGDKEAKRSGAEVDSILNRIKNGEIQLPPAAKGTEKPIEIPTPTSTPATTQKQTSFRSTHFSSSSTVLPKNHRASSSVNQVVRSSTVAPQTVTPSRQSTRGSSLFQYSFSATTPKPDDEGRSPYSTLPTFGTSERSNYLSVSPRVQRLSSTQIPEYVTASSVNYIHNVDAQKFVSSTRGNSASPTSAAPASIFSSPSYSPTFSTTPPSTFATSSTAAPELSNILRNKGLFAMAKYLKQSGLDSILNETGPYTIFAPTDKAFKSLLVQLGGPEKAEEKFKNNPRLLSGLLLHHVIPGSFKIEDLQDEMTGVSLAGTQLRVNQYQMQDTEWNDVKLTTINGATVANDNNDIVIPQGVAHSVDRVMFPLPVGDILQSLQSDRERRFTNFLRAVFASNMADTLQNKGASMFACKKYAETYMRKFLFQELRRTQCLHQRTRHSPDSRPKNSTRWSPTKNRQRSSSNGTFSPTPSSHRVCGSIK